MLNWTFLKRKGSELFNAFQRRNSTCEIHGLPRCSSVARSTLEKLPLATSFGTMELQEMSRWEVGSGKLEGPSALCDSPFVGQAFRLANWGGLGSSRKLGPWNPRCFHFSAFALQISSGPFKRTMFSDVSFTPLNGWLANSPHETNLAHAGLYSCIF